MRKFNLEEAKAGKEVVTLKHKSVRILAFDAEQSKPIVALVKDLNHCGEEVVTYFEDGRYDPSTETVMDLFMKPEKRKMWQVVYEDNGGLVGGTLHPTRHEAEMEAESALMGSIWSMAVDIVSVEVLY